MMKVRHFLWLLLGVSFFIAGCASQQEPHGVPIPVQAAPAAAVYVPKGKPAAKKFKVGEHGVLGFDLPRGWNYRPYRTSPLIPASFRLDAPDGSAAMIVSISWDGIGTGKEAPDEQLLERKLRNEAEKRIRTSVEKTVEVKTVILDDGHVQYAQFTQAMWVNAEVPKGNYRYSTDGVFRCGNLWGAITVYSQDKTGDSFRPALEVIKSFRKLDR